MAINAAAQGCNTSIPLCSSQLELLVPVYFLHVCQQIHLMQACEVTAMSIYDSGFDLKHAFHTCSFSHAKSPALSNTEW